MISGSEQRRTTTHLCIQGGNPMPTPQTSAGSKGTAKPKKSTESKSTGKKSMTGRFVTPEQRQHMIEEAAYFIAEKRGFAGGNSDADWLYAESQIDKMLTKG